MKKNKLKLLAMAGIVTVGSMISTGAFAASARSEMSYNVNVAAANGMAKVNGAKYNDGGTGSVTSGSIVGNYKLDARLHQNGSTSWKRIDDGTYVSWNIDKFKGDKTYGHEVYLHLSNDLLTPVKVNARGTWDAN